jgi:hypothetical protein
MAGGLIFPGDRRIPGHASSKGNMMGFGPRFGNRFDPAGRAAK